MHDIRWIRDNREAFERGLVRRQAPPEDATATAARLLTLDDERRAAIATAQAAQERRNAVSKEIGKAKGAKDEARAQALMAEVAGLRDTIAAGEAREKQATEALNAALADIPNLPLPEVPDGKDEHDNVEYRRFAPQRPVLGQDASSPSPRSRGEGRGEGAPHPNPLPASGEREQDSENWTPKQHFELGEALGLMDFETAAKLSGSRFVVLKKGLARLQRALGQFMLDLHTTEHGYTEVQPPLLVKDEVMFGTAQLPKFADDQFLTSNLADLTTGLADAANRSSTSTSLADIFAGAILRDAAIKQSLRWLIPTAEVPLTNLVRESVVPEAELPLRFTALTPCFRAEAGAAGRDTRGMLRQHQFDKVELVSITTPEKSGEEHERLLSCAEAVMKKLDLHYRVMTLCTGDMGFASRKTYDIEAWLPGQGTYREISSCSVCGDFQARRMNARYRPAAAEGGKPAAPRLVHTLNGSGTAVGRCLIAVMENYQNPDGSITVPEALVPYMGGTRRVGR